MEKTLRRQSILEWSSIFAAALGVSACAVQPSLPERPVGAAFGTQSQAGLAERFKRQRGRAQTPKAAASTDGVELVIPKGHSSTYTAVALSPDGRSILSLNMDDTAKLWDVASGRELRTFAGFEFLMAGTGSFTGDGRSVLISDLQSARVYDVESGRELHRIGSSRAQRPLVTGDGRYALVDERTLNEMGPTLIEVATRKPVWRLPKDGMQQAFLLSVDGRVLITTKHLEIDPRRVLKGELDISRLADAELLIWDVPERKLRGRVPYASSHRAKALSRDNRLLALEKHDRTLSVIDLQSRKELRTFATGKVDAYTLVFSDDSRLLARAAVDGVHVWEVASGRVVAEVQASAVNFSRDGSTLVLGALAGGAPWLRDLTSGKETRLAGGSSGVSDLTIFGRGRSALAGMYDGTAKLWDLTTGQIVRTLPCSGGAPVSSVSVSVDERIAALGCMDGSVALLELSTGRRMRELPAPQKQNYTHTHVRFTPDGRGLVVAAADQVTVWDLAAGKAVRQFTASAQRPRNQFIEAMQGQARALAGAESAERLAEVDRQFGALAVHPGGKLIALAHSSSVTLWDLDAGKFLTSLGRRQGEGATPNGTAGMAEAMRRQSQGGVALGSPEAAGLLGSIFGRSQQAQQPVMAMDPSQLFGDLMPLMTRSLAFSVDGRILSTGLRLWDANTGAEISRGPSPDSGELHPFVDDMAEASSAAMSSGAAFSPDGRMAARAVGQVVRIVEVAGGKEQIELVGHSSNVKTLAYSPDGRHLLSGADDGAIKLWDLATGKELVSLIALGREDFAAVTPDQYYRISKAGAKGVGFRVRERIYPFEQFDLRFNRPDIVLQQLGAASPETVQSYRSAYERRLKKMGLSEQMLSTDFHVPEVEILTRDVPVSINAAAFALRVRATDSRYALDRLNVYVNDVPVHGSGGIVLREKNTQSHEQEIQVPLLPGRNKIQVSVLNQQGTESLKQTVYTTSSAQFAPADVYVLAIGVSEYRDKTYNLRFAAKDAADLVAAYKAAEGRPKEWGKVHSLTLTDRNATRAEILKAKDWLTQAKVNDLVVVFAAGHGMTDDQSNYYFGTHDIDPRNPASRGLPYDEFEFLLDGVPAMQKLLLLDTCFSGEIEKEQPVAVAAVPGVAARAGTVRMRAFRSARGVAVVGDEVGAAAGSQLSAAMLRFQQDWFADLRRGTGAAVISSSSGNEYSLEGEQWRNGVFTYALLQGLKNRLADANKDRVITVSELQAYVIDQVRALTQGGQNPTVRRENLEYDFAVY